MQIVPFQNLNISCHSLLACNASVEKAADNLIRVQKFGRSIRGGVEFGCGCENVPMGR